VLAREPGRDVTDSNPPSNISSRVTEPIRIGLLYSLSGELGITEASILRGALLAIDEVNAAGGVRGRPLEGVVVDCASDLSVAFHSAQGLASDPSVLACVGGYTSASRVAMAPAFRAHGATLVYSTYYEGLEIDDSVFYAGAIPNQFLVDYVAWITSNLGTRLYVVGSDYVYPRTLGAIIRGLVRGRAEIIADRYVPLGSTRVDGIIEEIQRIKPDVIISNLVGITTPAFYREFREAGLKAEQLPIAATVTTELDINLMGPETAQGHFMTATYFQSLDNPANAEYVAAIKHKFGADAVTHIPQVGAYNAIWLVALAAQGAGELTHESLRDALPGTRFEASPEGFPTSIFDNHHTDHPSYIGLATPEGQFKVIASFPPTPPDPYPPAIVPTWKRPPVGAPGS
jgi:urea transport system substrate-binding protein